MRLLGRLQYRICSGISAAEFCSRKTIQGPIVCRRLSAAHCLRPLLSTGALFWFFSVRDSRAPQTRALFLCAFGTLCRAAAVCPRALDCDWAPVVQMIGSNGSQTGRGFCVYWKAVFEQRSRRGQRAGPEGDSGRPLAPSHWTAFGNVPTVLGRRQTAARGRIESTWLRK